MWKKIVLFAIVFCVIGRLVVSPLPVNEDLTTASDQGGYLHFSWFLRAHPAENWDSYWYGGFPQLRFYPPAVLYMQSILSNLISDILAFKFILSLAFILTPIAFYYLLKEFRLSQKEKVLSLMIFSFMFFYNSTAYSGKSAIILAVLSGLVFFKFFIRSLKSRSSVDIGVSSAFLALTLLTHSLTSIMYIGLSAIYLIAWLYSKFDWRKVKSTVLIYASGFILSAYWLIPSLLEGKYALSGIYDELESSILNLSPFTMVLRTFGANVNLFTIFMTIIAVVLICFSFYYEYKKRKNTESLFLVLSAVIFIGGYFVLFYFIGNMPFSPEKAIVLWPIILSILIAKSATKKILTYLAIVLIVLQLVLFFGVPMQNYAKSDYTKIDASLQYLQDKDGRVSVQPRYAPYTLATINDYRVPLFGKENEFSTFPETLSEARYNYIYQNYGFGCIGKQTVSERIFSTDFLDRHYIKTQRCELETKNLEDYFFSMDVSHVIVNKEFPEVDAYFSNNTAYNKVREDAFFSVYELVKKSQYVQSEQNISYSYYKLPDKIVINLHSDSKIGNVTVRISEGWYPYWVSNDAKDIRADRNGFMMFNVPEISGDKEITLEFKQPAFYGYLPLLSFFWLCFLVLNCRFDILHFNR
jgi:hypothetical protein